MIKGETLPQIKGKVDYMYQDRNPRESTDVRIEYLGNVYQLVLCQYRTGGIIENPFTDNQKILLLNANEDQVWAYLEGIVPDNQEK